MEAAKPHLSGLGKCALFASFIFAAAIWWVVAESNTSAMEYRTPLINPEHKAEKHIWRPIDLLLVATNDEAAVYDGRD